MTGTNPRSEKESAADRLMVIACGVLRLDIQRLAAESGITVDTCFLEGGLHDKPMELRRQLQEAIDAASASGRYARIAVGYGVCGRGSVSIKARTVPLVIPRVHDCIALFLGSTQAYKEQFKRFPGTYYISAGWQAEKTDPLTQKRLKKRAYIFMDNKRVYYDDLVQQVGVEAAKETFKFFDTWKQNYRRAAFIDTGAGTPAEYESLAREMAETYGWRYERLQGDVGLLQRLLTADTTTDDILWVPPEHVTVFNPLAGGLQASPVMADAVGDRPSPAPAGDRHQVMNKISPADTAPRIRVGLGIDAGGTYTDAVLFDLQQRKVLDKHKALTTKWDYTQGIGEALAGLDPEILLEVELVAVSTTLATNAIVEGDGQKVGLLLMTPYGLSDPKEIPYEPKVLLQGAMEISGRVQTPLDEEQVRREAGRMKARHGVQAFAVSGFAGAINPTHELNVKRIVQQETGCLVTCGHELSDLLNFKTRAETAVLNARIVPRLVKLLDDLEHVLKERQVQAPIMVVKGDGSLMGRAMAAERPVETILSGPAASVAGARFLTGHDHALVVDMGGTTTDTAALAGGEVETDPTGSRVGKAQTHVKALKIRTCGLGGDSLISYDRGEFAIGPRRVAPMAWLAKQYPHFDRVMDDLQRASRYSMGNAKFLTVLALTDDRRDRLELADNEIRLLDLLKQRPHGIDALARRLGVLHPTLLPLDRLEENYLIQRCGLTPTDLLHVSGEFDRWDANAARRVTTLLANLSELEVDNLIDRLNRQMVRRLAMELMKKQIEPETDPEALENCPVCRVLLNRMFQSDTNVANGSVLTDNPGAQDYQVAFRMERPIIGIGAPIGHFLPPAAKLLGGEAVLPDHADVANAVGAVTSHIRVQREVKIRPDDGGGFYIEGLPQAPRFPKFDRADQFAREALAEGVAKLARAAGTSHQGVTIQHHDRTVKTAQGDTLFLERTLTAELSGQPDLALRAQVA